MNSKFETTIQSLASKHYSEDHLDALSVWCSPVPHFKPTVNTRRATLRIACILSENMYRSLNFEASLLMLTESNWSEILQYGKPDVFLVDSFWSTVTGDWYLSQSCPGKSHDRLQEIITMANSLGVPTVFWNTVDFLYYDLFKNTSLKFDYIFCSDDRVAEDLAKSTSNVEILLPAIQPALFNPFRNWQFADHFQLSILFDGWADIFRFDNKFDYLKMLKGNGLSIIESNYKLFKAKIQDTPDFAENILGCVGFIDRLMALKYSTLNIMDECTLLTPTRQIWTSLEIAACRVPILFRGKVTDDDIHKTIVQELPDPNDLVHIAQKLLTDKILSETMAQKSWRSVHLNHTFSQRINSICSAINIKNCSVEYPLVSIIIPTFRINLLNECIKQFDSQTYPNKELVLVINSSSVKNEDFAHLIGTREDIRYQIIPSDRVEGGCLNFGIMSAKGEHCMKMDDDDYYGENYVLDMMLHNNAVNADVYGKSNRFFHFEDDNSTYERQRRTRPQLSIIDDNDVVTAHISGNTLSGKTSFFRQHRYSDTNFGSTDTDFHHCMTHRPATYALFDDLGVVMNRGKNTNDHSWRPSNEKLKKQMRYIGKGIPDFLK